MFRNHSRRAATCSALFLGTLVCCTLPAPGADSTRAANTVVLDETAVRNLNLATVEVEESDFEETIFALGQIRVAPGHRYVVSSRIAGRASSVAAHIDTPVQKGAEVAVIESRQPGDPPPGVRLTAPATGYISAVNVAAGQPVSPDDSLVEILDLAEVHAVAAVPEHLAGRIKIGMSGRICSAAYPEEDFQAKVEHLGTEADFKTGTIEVAFSVANADALLRPGLRAEFSIITARREGVMSIPRTALQGDVATRFVYVEDFDLKNAFIKTPVVTGAQNSRSIEITSGLLPGDKVVTRGAYALAFAGKGSMSLKEALDAAHGHEHAEDGSELPSGQRTAATGARADHDHEHGSGASHTLTVFFAATSVVLLLLLLAALFLRRQPASA